MAKFFKKVGAFFGKVARVALPVVGAVVGVGAIGGVIKGVGALRGVGGTVTAVTGGVKKVIDKVAVSAINLATGTTQPERIQVREQKQLTKAEVDKWQQVERLVKAGMLKEAAMAAVGVTEAGTVEVVTDYDTVAKKKNNVLIYAGLGLAGLFLLPKLLKGR